MLDIQAVIDKQGIANLHKIQKQIPFATRLALGRVARAVLAAQKAGIATSFDKPTAFARNSLKLTLSTSGQDPEASIGPKEVPSGSSYDPVNFLAPEIHGGSRTTKRFEQKLIDAGILPAGKRIMPSKTLKLDHFGNIPRSLINKLTTALFSADKGVRKGKKAGYLVIQKPIVVPNGPTWPAGIYLNSLAKSELLLAFTSPPNYKQRYDFFGIGNDVLDRTYAKEFEKALDYAIRTAK